MLQRILVIFCLLNFSVTLYLIFSRTTADEIVYIDSVKLLNGYRGMIDARTVFQQKTVTWKANIDSLNSNVQKSILSYEKESRSMTSTERELTRELIQTKQNQLSQYQEVLNSKAQEEDSKMTADVISQVNAYLKRYGAEHNYQIIFAANESANIAYADDSKDITGEVLDGINKEYSGTINR
ncbi:OmpH family outer membrane protein [Parachryseolinea silvisoli]|uniref:OmpH family outer membrane protein n=1 Tax=Parachryseolinea silvisoli TaxID=2873601 RepID=UPI0022659564|nr:OmpH family outer membrane protein [Parachryseolinea silvisoli]MCD9015475.1 OmpH family outer membrane protein [Parachryseolinea silvisoli]